MSSLTFKLVSLPLSPATPRINGGAQRPEHREAVRRAGAEGASCSALFSDVPLEQRLEVRNRKPCITYDSSHGDCVDGVMARNGEDPLAVAHYHVLPLPHYSEARLLERPNCIEVVDAGELRQR